MPQPPSSTEPSATRRLLQMSDVFAFANRSLILLRMFATEHRRPGKIPQRSLSSAAAGIDISADPIDDGCRVQVA